MRLQTWPQRAERTSACQEVAANCLHIDWHLADTLAGVQQIHDTCTSARACQSLQEHGVANSRSRRLHGGLRHAECLHQTGAQRGPLNSQSSKCNCSGSIAALQTTGRRYPGCQVRSGSLPPRGSPAQEQTTH